MARMKLKAATLIESLVAMVIVMLCFGISAMIYVNVMNADNQRLKLSAHLLLNETAVLTKTGKNFLDREIKGERLDIKASFTKYRESSDLTLMTLTAVDKEGKLLGTRKEIISTAWISD